MEQDKCPNCREYINASTTRLVRDACGHSKCRMCLVYEEEGCKTCQNELRIQKIGSFDYPVPSVDLSASDPSSEKEEITLQPLELVINKTLDHDSSLFNEHESCESESSACHLEWTNDRDLSSEDVAGHENAEALISVNAAIQSSEQKDSGALLQRLVTPGKGFDAGNRNVELQTCTLPQSHALETAPLGLFIDVDSPLRNDNDQQNALVQTANQCEKKVTIDRCVDEEQFDFAEKEKAQKPKGRRNCKLKRSHISVIPGIRETYKCNICGKSFKSATAQRYHDFCLTGVKPYKCTICNRTFVKQSHFQYHERTHSGYKPFECSFCGKAFPQRNKLNRHLYSHQYEKRYKCSICEKGYCSRDDLKSHMNIHTGVMPYTCQVCKKSFRESTNLTRHMHTHSNERPHMCEQCGKSFKDKSLLVRHKRIHGKDRPFSCSDCTRVFLSKSELSRHLAVHSDDKPFPCSFCSTVFRRKDNLNRHTRHHHSEDQTAPPEKKSKNEEADTQPLKSRLANIPKQKAKPKGKLKSTSAILPKSPGKISVFYLNSHEQINSRLDSRSNVTPVIRPISELSNAVPVINGPISIKRPEENINSPKKAFTHTEPIPLAEAVVINRRIEEKLYPKTNMNHDCYFEPDFCNIVERQHSIPKIIPLRPNLASKTMPLGKTNSPEGSFLEPQIPLTQQNRPEKYNKVQYPLSKQLLSADNRTPEIITTWSDCQDTKGFNTPRYTVPKKRAIDELKSKPNVNDSGNRLPSYLPEASLSSSALEPERANCVPTITKAGHANGNNGLKEFNSSNMVNVNSEILSESNVRNIEDANKSTNIRKLSDIHWRRRTSEILKPRINGFNSMTNCQLSELEVPKEMTDMKKCKG